MHATKSGWSYGCGYMPGILMRAGERTVVFSSTIGRMKKSHPPDRVREIMEEARAATARDYPDWEDANGDLAVTHLAIKMAGAEWEIDKLKLMLRIPRCPAKPLDWREKFVRWVWRVLDSCPWHSLNVPRVRRWIRSAEKLVLR